MIKNKLLIILLLISASTTVSAQNYKKIGECVGIFSYATTKGLMTPADLMFGAGVIKQYQIYAVKIWVEKFQSCTDKAPSINGVRQVAPCLSNLSPKDSELMKGMMAGMSAGMSAPPGNQWPYSIMPTTNRACSDAADSQK